MIFPSQITGQRNRTEPTKRC